MVLPWSLHKAVVELQRPVIETKIDTNDTQMEKCLSVKEREKRQNFQTTVQLPPEDNLRNVSYLKGKVKYDSSLFWQIGIVSLI